VSHYFVGWLVGHIRELWLNGIGCLELPLNTNSKPYCQNSVAPFSTPSASGDPDLGSGTV